MVGCYEDIEKITKENDYFREVLFTGPLSQLVVMSLNPGEDIGLGTIWKPTNSSESKRAKAKPFLMDNRTHSRKGRQSSSRLGQSTISSIVLRKMR
jgi:hypothetical protein